jgi:hypothetical protein
MDNTLINVAELTEEQLQHLEAQIEAKKQAKKREIEKAEIKWQKDVDDLVNFNCIKFQQMSEKLRKLKHTTIAQANELYERMFTIRGKEIKEQKSFSFKNTEGDLQIEVSRPDRIELSPQADVHITAIKEIFKAKYGKLNQGMYNIIDTLLSRNGQGDYDPKMLAKVRKHIYEQNSQELVNEFEALTQCQVITGSALYVRASALNKETQKWESINLQFSSL